MAENIVSKEDNFLSGAMKGIYCLLWYHIISSRPISQRAKDNGDDIVFFETWKLDMLKSSKHWVKGSFYRAYIHV